MLGVPEELVQAYITVLLQYKKGLTLGSKGIKYRKNKKTQGKQALDPFSQLHPSSWSLLSTTFKATAAASSPSPCCPPPEISFHSFSTPSVPSSWWGLLAARGSPFCRAPDAGDQHKGDFPEIHCFKQTQVPADEVSQTNQEVQQVTHRFCLLSREMTTETHIHLLTENQRLNVVWTLSCLAATEV